MIDPKMLLEHFDEVRANAQRRKCAVDFDTLAQVYKLVRQMTVEVEELRAKRNKLSKECKDNPEAREQVRELKERLSASEGHLNRLYQHHKLNLLLKPLLVWRLLKNHHLKLMSVRFHKQVH